MRILVDDHEGPVALRHGSRGAAHLNIGLAFIREAFGLVGAHANTVVDDVKRVGAGRTVNRTAVVLINVDELRKHLLGENNVFTGDDARAADRHTGGGTAAILRHQALVGGVTAGGEYNAELALDKFRALLGASANARDGTGVFIGQQFDNLGVELNLDAKLAGLGHQNVGKLLAARLGFAQRQVSAFEHRVHKLHTGGELHTNVVHHPVHHVVGMFGHIAGQRLVALTLRDLHHVFIELFARVTGISVLCLLRLGMNTEHEACGINGVTGRRTHLFNQNGLQAILCGANSANQTTATGTDDHEVVGRFSDLLGSSLSRCGSACTDHCCAAERSRFQESTAGIENFGHGSFSPLVIATEQGVFGASCRLLMSTS